MVLFRILHIHITFFFLLLHLICMFICYSVFITKISKKKARKQERTVVMYDRAREREREGLFSPILISMGVYYYYQLAILIKNSNSSFTNFICF